MKRDEFLRRWGAMPEVKHAELIGGVVYRPSPLSVDHSSLRCLVSGWLGYYAARTPGCDAGNNGTWLMLEDAPQPDVNLRILPEYGGQSRVEGLYCAGAPELAAEVSLSSASYDLGPKMELYRAAGVQEYVVVLLGESRSCGIGWWTESTSFYNLAPMVSAGGRKVRPSTTWLRRTPAFRRLSRALAGPAALLARNGARIFDVLDLGLRSPEHQEFVRALAQKLSPSSST